MNFPIMLNEPIELFTWIGIGLATGIFLGIMIGIWIGIHIKKLPGYAEDAVKQVLLLSTQLRAQGDELGREKAKVADYKAGIASNAIMKGEIIAFMEKII